MGWDLGVGVGVQGAPTSLETLIPIQGSSHTADAPSLPFAQSLTLVSLSSQHVEFSSHPGQNLILPNTPASDIVDSLFFWTMQHVESEFPVCSFAKSGTTLCDPVD